MKARHIPDSVEAVVVMAGPCVCGFPELLQMHQNLHEPTLLGQAEKTERKVKWGKQVQFNSSAKESVILTLTVQQQFYSQPARTGSSPLALSSVLICKKAGSLAIRVPWRGTHLGKQKGFLPSTLSGPVNPPPGEQVQVSYGAGFHSYKVKHLNCSLEHQFWIIQMKLFKNWLKFDILGHTGQNLKNI